MHKVLIANRGEIALRVIRACKELGLQTVAVYSKADSESLHVLSADEAICIGEAPSSQSYLKIPSILSACEITGADAIHPGYGFLSENAKFAALCEESGIEFIGPSSKVINSLGNKAQAKATAKLAKCPVIPGSDGIVKDINEALRVAKEMHYPIFIKAVSGGGGKGIRIAHDEEELKKGFKSAATEAEVSFGNPDLYLEKMIVNPRHIEVQVIADKKGNTIHLYERDCTIQRRRQKLIEEAPSPVLTHTQRKKIGESAVRVAQQAGYSSAGTVEFLLDKNGDYYFMEMNTRIQVEHTVTEELTGLDLVKMQLEIALGKPLGIKQKDVQIRGHVIQYRVNAEDVSQGFAPRPGTLEYFIPPGGPNVRVDSGCYSGYKIPSNYDSMIAKLIVRGKNRTEAIAVGKRALGEFYIHGVPTTIPFHLYMMEDEPFLSSNYTITYIDDEMADGRKFCLDE